MTISKPTTLTMTALYWLASHTMASSGKFTATPAVPPIPACTLMRDQGLPSHFTMLRLCQLQPGPAAPSKSTPTTADRSTASDD